MGAKVVRHAGIRTMELTIPNQRHALPTRLPGPTFWYIEIDFILATTFTSDENNRDHSKM